MGYNRSSQNSNVIKGASFHYIEKCLFGIVWCNSWYATV